MKNLALVFAAVLGSTVLATAAPIKQTKPATATAKETVVAKPEAAKTHKAKKAKKAKKEVAKVETTKAEVKK
ncbi:MAG: hypothetical protein ABI554_10875 [Flavobacterium sp.]